MYMLLLILFIQLFLKCHGYEEIEGRVVNGVNAENFIPYQASIRVSIRDYLRYGRGHTCGAVLVNSRTALTAAHCLYNGDNYRTIFDIHVVLGSLNRYIFTEETVIMHAERIIIHPEYTRRDFPHDIGIVILRQHIEFSDYIQPIQLVNRAMQAGSRCQVSGWGGLYWQGIMPAQLQKANVTIFDRNRCNSSYGGMITEGMVCANGLTDTGKVIDVCQGDSGGPLQCNGYLVGLASFGAQCGASEEHPGVFVDIYYYRNWIMENWIGNGAVAAMQKSHKTSIFMFTLFVNLIWNLKL